MDVNGRSLETISKDIAEGYFVLNPLTLKRIDPEHYSPLHAALRKEMNITRIQGFPAHDLSGIRKRNTRLQRLYQATAVLENLAKQKKIKLL
jgi:hypothetical protein